MEKKGFTLVELLSVIVILSVIVLITTPIIFKVIGKTKRKAAESSVLGYVKAFENTIMTNQLSGLSVADGGYSIKDFDVLVSGQEPTKGKIIVKDSNVEKAFICYDGYSIKYEASKAYLSDDDYCNKDLTSSITLNIGTNTIKEDIGYDSFKSFKYDLSSYQSILCNNEVSVSYSDGLLGLNDVYTDTICTTYNKTSSALSNLDSSQNYLLILNDEEIDTALTLNQSKTLILDLNGHKIVSNSDSSNIINTRVSSNITIKNGTLEGTYVFDMSGVVNLYDVFINFAGAIWVRDNAILNIYDGTLLKSTNVKEDKTISLYSVKNTNIGGTVNMYGGKIESAKRSIVNEHGGTVNIYGGEIVSNEKNTISNLQKGTINISGGKIENKGLQNSLDVCNSNTGIVNITGGTFNSNGDITLYNKKGIMNVSGGTFTSINHGNIYNEEGIVNISGSPIFTTSKTILATFSGVINVNGGIYNTASNSTFARSNANSNYSGGVINICKAKTNSPKLSVGSFSNYIYYADNGIDWNGNSNPTITGDAKENIIMNNEKACQKVS